MKEIIKALDKFTLKQELKKIGFLRKTVRGGNEIYIFNSRHSLPLMDEIGRLREITFRHGGGGTGKASDVDKYDLMDRPFNQLLLWDPDGEEIVGGYRFLMGHQIENDPNGNPVSPTSKLFSFSTQFLQDFWPQTMELGRSFVVPYYQPNVNRSKGIYALDNLWDGLGALVVEYPEMRYFFGKMTMYTDFNKKARDLILYFLEKHFPDRDRLVWSNYPVVIENDKKELAGILDQRDYKNDYKILNREVRELGEYIPPLFTAYMNLSTTMRSFGTSINESFGAVEETGILITIDDIHKEKIERYVHSYKPEKPPQ